MEGEEVVDGIAGRLLPGCIKEERRRKKRKGVAIRSLPSTKPFGRGWGGGLDIYCYLQNGRKSHGAISSTALKLSLFILTLSFLFFFFCSSGPRSNGLVGGHVPLLRTRSSSEWVAVADSDGLLFSLTVEGIRGGKRESCRSLFPGECAGVSAWREEHSLILIIR